jgi:Flp pilus assembly protein TadG
MWGRSEGLKRRRFLRRFLKSQDGAAAVEFALVAGPFFFVLGSIAETGLMLFSEYVIQNAVQGAAREIRTHQVATDTGTLLMTQAEFKTKLCSRLTSLIDCAGGVTVYVNSATDFAGLKAAMPSFIAIGAGGPSSYNPGASLKAVGVIATYDWDFAFPLMDFLGNIDGGSKRRLHGIAIFNNEP